MSRILKCGFNFCGESFGGTLNLPDEYFDGEGRPIRHELNRRLSAQPNISYTDEPCPVKEPPSGIEVRLIEPPKDFSAELLELTAAVQAMVKLQSVLIEIVKIAVGGAVEPEVKITFVEPKEGGHV